MGDILKAEMNNTDIYVFEPPVWWGWAQIEEGMVRFERCMIFMRR